jgi:propionate CoA-transferase
MGVFDWGHGDKLGQGNEPLFFADSFFRGEDRRANVADGKELFMNGHEKLADHTSGHPMLSVSPPLEVKKGKVVSAQEAVRIIRDGDTVLSGGFVGCGYAEEISLALEKLFLETGHPRDLTLLYAAGQGDGRERGLNQLAHEGLLRRVIGGHWGLCPRLQKLAFDNKILAYCLPQGVISHMVRDAAGKRPRTITSVGLGTFVDPRIEGGRINSVTTEEIVEFITIDGKEYLSYKPVPVNVAILRGTTADTNGNITMEKEALILDSLNAAIAAKNNRGFVMVQVERIAERGSLNPRDVVIPGVLVDCVVLSTPDHHWQTFAEQYNPSYSGRIKATVQTIEPMELSARKIVARRAALELRANSVVNLGIGMPEGVASVANEERILEFLTLTAEPGSIGGVTAGGLSFGAAVNPEAIIDMASQFDLYDGGGLDAAFLGMAEADGKGDVNVSKFGPKLAGAGGFINISQNAAKVVFMGTFDADGLSVSACDGELRITGEGKLHKFVQKVEQITFSGSYAAAKAQPVIYVTERCVFRLNRAGLELVEIAPGIDLKKDVLDLMDFQPIMNEPPRLMDARIFRDEPMGLKNEIMEVPLQDRLTYHPEENLFFVNFEGYTVKSPEQVKEIEKAVSRILAPLNKKVFTIVNYDNFSILPDIVDDYSAMVKRLVENFYYGTTRYTTSAFLRMKLGESLERRDLAPHIYENREEAARHLARIRDSKG